MLRRQRGLTRGYSVEKKIWGALDATSRPNPTPVWAAPHPAPRTGKRPQKPHTGSLPASLGMDLEGWGTSCKGKGKNNTQKNKNKKDKRVLSS